MRLPYLPLEAVIDECIKRLVTDAGEAGNTRAELEEANGGSADFVAEKFDDAIDAEVQRLASKDD